MCNTFVDPSSSSRFYEDPQDAWEAEEEAKAEREAEEAEREHLEDKDFWSYLCHDCGNPNNNCTCGGYN
jgi:hypothetical protein